MSTQPLKMSTRDFSWGKGGRCVWLTTYHPCSAESREDPGPSPTRNPLGHLGLLWDKFTLFTLYIYIYVCVCVCVCVFIHAFTFALLINSSNDPVTLICTNHVDLTECTTDICYNIMSLYVNHIKGCSFCTRHLPLRVCKHIAFAFFM